MSSPSSQEPKPPYLVPRAELPFYCPTPEMTQWNSHPKVFIALEGEQETLCPYCGTAFKLAPDEH